MATSIDQKNYVKTALRLPPELHASVHESAQDSGRSYNAELVERIQRSYEDSLSGDGAALLLGLQYDLAASQTNLHMVRLRFTELAEKVIRLHDNTSRMTKKELDREIAAIKVFAEHYLQRHKSDFAKLREAYGDAEKAAINLVDFFANADESDPAAQVSADEMLKELRSGKPRAPKP